MKNLTVLSIVVASLLLVGCNEGTEADAKAEASTHTEKTAMKCAPGKCGGDMKKEATEAKSKVDEAKEAVSNAVEKTKDAVAQKASSVIEATKTVASEAKDAVEKKVEEAKSVVSEKVSEAKDAVSKKVDEAKEAVASATTEAPASYTACAGCHGKDGKLKALGKSEIIAGQAKADIITKLNGYKAGTLNVTGMGGLMKGQTAKLSDADIEALATYISGLKK